MKGGGSGSAWVPAGGWLLAFFAAMTLYSLTMAPDLVWHDAGYYQWESARLNLVRPGEAVRVHPFFILLAHGLGRLGIWNYAKAASLASAVGTAVAVGNVWLIVWLLTRRPLPAVLATIVAMLAHTVWQLAVQPQTYGWSNAATTGMLASALAYASSRRLRWVLAASFIGGLGLSIHLMSQLAVVVIGVWLVAAVIRRRAPVWTLPAALGLWTAGAALFWYVAYLEYARTHDLLATARSAIIGPWGPAVFNVSGLPRMLVRSLLMFVLNFPTPLVLLVGWGLRCAVRLSRDARSEAGSGGLGWAMIAMAAAYGLFAVRYRVPNQNFFFTPFYMLTAVGIGLGFHGLGWSERRGAAVCAAALALVVVPAYAIMAEVARCSAFDLTGSGKMHAVPYRDIYTYYFCPWQHRQTGPRRFAQEVLSALPPGALLLPDTTTAPPLKYVHDVEGVRPDVLIVDPYDAQFDRTLSKFWHSKDSLLSDLEAEGRRAFVVSDQAGYMPRWVEHHCRLQRVRPPGYLFEVRPPEERP